MTAGNVVGHLDGSGMRPLNVFHYVRECIELTRNNYQRQIGDKLRAEVSEGNANRRHN